MEKRSLLSRCPSYYKWCFPVKVSDESKVTKVCYSLLQVLGGNVLLNKQKA